MIALHRGSKPPPPRHINMYWMISRASGTRSTELLCGNLLSAALAMRHDMEGSGKKSH